jgi:hypothetical protein
MVLSYLNTYCGQLIQLTNHYKINQPTITPLLYLCYFVYTIQGCMDDKFEHVLMFELHSDLQKIHSMTMMQRKKI